MTSEEQIINIKMVVMALETITDEQLGRSFKKTTSSVSRLALQFGRGQDAVTKGSIDRTIDSMIGLFPSIVRD